MPLDVSRTAESTRTKDITFTYEGEDYTISVYVDRVTDESQRQALAAARASVSDGHLSSDTSQALLRWVAEWGDNVTDAGVPNPPNSESLISRLPSEFRTAAFMGILRGQTVGEVKGTVSQPS